MLDTTTVTMPAASAPAPRHWDSRRVGAALAAARHHTSRRARRGRLQPADREDLRQDALVAVVVRSQGYDPALGAWSTFADLVVRHALADRDAARSTTSHLVFGIELDDLPAAAAADPTSDLVTRLDLERLWPCLPPPLQRVLALVAREGSVAEACRASAMPAAAFYRAVADLRLWLRAAGLAPPEKECGVHR